jgi:hypothetical protein
MAEGRKNGKHGGHEKAFAKVLFPRLSQLRMKERRKNIILVYAETNIKTQHEY